MTYPAVLDERATLDRVLAGASLCRFGDGEFNLCAGVAAKAQDPDPRLQRRLTSLLQQPPADCLVGIPNVQSPTPKATFWQPQADRARRWLSPHGAYASAFISRPDSAPWIHTPDYWRALETLWIDQDVTLVRGGRHGLATSDLVGANQVREVVGPSTNAWAEYAALLQRIGTPRRVLLCLGPSATVLSADLAARGVHAIDLGHVGLFLRKYRAGLPMVVTAEDKAA